MLVGLALIAKNEAQRLPTLLASIEGAFDQVVLLDTGSVDTTVQVFETWAKKQPGLSYKVGHHKWSKDFGEARRLSQAMLDTEWEVWADCDDIIVGAQNIRQVAATAADGVAAFIAGYNYAQHPQTGECVCYLKRERIIRKGLGKWIHRVHEAQLVNGQVAELAPTVVEWVHRKQGGNTPEVMAKDANRNLDILNAWHEEEPENTRVLAYLGTENMVKGNTEGARPYFEQYLSLNPDWDEERAQVHRKLALCYLTAGEYDKAIATAFEALRLLPAWQDSYLTLAEAHNAKGEYHRSIEWAREAIRRGSPQTLLIINPLDYTYQPRRVLAASLAALNQWDEAIQVGSEAWQMNPADQELGGALQGWRAMAKREHTANTIAMMAQQLIAHDEQLKALTLLEECVPHFITDHPGIVQLRSMLRERLEWMRKPSNLLEHYATGGSKPEDFVSEDKIDQVAGSLPRTAFLYKGIHDQLLEQHHEGLIREAEGQVFPMLEAVGAGTP